MNKTTYEQTTLNDNILTINILNFNMKHLLPFLNIYLNHALILWARGAGAGSGFGEIVVPLVVKGWEKNKASFLLGVFWPLHTKAPQQKMLRGFLKIELVVDY
jgi:hypothetical protein